MKTLFCALIMLQVELHVNPVGHLQPTDFILKHLILIVQLQLKEKNNQKLLCNPFHGLAIRNDSRYEKWSKCCWVFMFFLQEQEFSK